MSLDDFPPEEMRVDPAVGVGPLMYFLAAEYLTQRPDTNKMVLVREWVIGRIGQENKMRLHLIRNPIEGESGRALPYQLSQTDMRLKNKYAHIDSPMVTNDNP